MKSAIKRIMNIDIKRLNKCPLESNGIYIIFDESNIMKASALIIGPKDTLYENAFLFFDITFPNNYPYSPPYVKYSSQNNVRIHPNIYVNGKVCLSILGTWSGPSWTCAMDITNVLVTIQSLLDNNPLLHEPGFENILTGNEINIELNDKYNQLIRYNSINSLIFDQLIYLPEKYHIFQTVLKDKLIKNKKEIFNKIKDEDLILDTQLKIYNTHHEINYINLNKKYLEKFENYH